MHSADRTSRFNSDEDFATLELLLPLPQREGDSFTGAVPKNYPYQPIEVGLMVDKLKKPFIFKINMECHGKLE